MTACVTVSPSLASAVSFIFCRMKAEICCGRILLAVGFDPGVAVGAFDDLVGDEVLVLLDHRVVVPAADQALDGEERVDAGW